MHFYFITGVIKRKMSMDISVTVEVTQGREDKGISELVILHSIQCLRSPAVCRYE